MIRMQICYIQKYKYGTVVSTEITDDGQTDVDNWTDIVAISAAKSNTIGLKKDGTVVSTKHTYSYCDRGQTNVDDWTNIVAISAGKFNTIGLKKDGTVVSTKITDEDDDYGQYGQSDVDDWTDIG